MSTRTRPTTLVAGILSMLLVAVVVAPAAAADPVSGDTAPAGAAPAVAASAEPSTSTTKTAQPAVDPEPTPEPTPEPKYRFTGYGTDHGVGLSQRGAAGRAAAGQTYDEILHQYFYNVEIDTVPKDTTIRALVVKVYRAASTQTQLIKGLVSRWSVDSPDDAVAGKTFPAGWTLVLKGRGDTGTWHLEIQGGGITKYAFTDTDAKVEVTPVAPATEGDPVGSIQVLIRPSTKYDTYLGSIRIGRTDGRLRVVNIVPIEPFVRSVSPQELGPTNLPETLKSQAVVARSYFLAGLSASTSWLGFDVESYRDSQSYKGIKGEKATVTRSVDATAYQVLRYFKKSDGKWHIARTFYHAVGGGATEASHNVFTGSTGKPGAKTPYLRGGPDVDANGVPYDAAARDYSWSTRAITLTQLSAILAHDSRTNVGTLTKWPIEAESTFRSKRAAALVAGGTSNPAPSNRGISGRLTWVVLIGTKNGKTVTKQVAGWLFKSVFNSNRGSGDPLGSTLIFRAPAN